MRDFELLVFIGRFQPFHLGHLSVVEYALERSNHLLILCGEGPLSFNIYGPSFTKKLIVESLTSEQKERVQISFIKDVCDLGSSRYSDPRPDNNKWVESVLQRVDEAFFNYRNQKIGLIGHQKDDSSYYLDLFPDWESVRSPNFKSLNATDIRERIDQSGLNYLLSDEADNHMTQATISLLIDFYRNR